MEHVAVDEGFASSSGRTDEFLEESFAGTMRAVGYFRTRYEDVGVENEEGIVAVDDERRRDRRVERADEIDRVA